MSLQLYDSLHLVSNRTSDEPSGCIKPSPLYSAINKEMAFEVQVSGVNVSERSARAAAKNVSRPRDFSSSLNQNGAMYDFVHRCLVRESILQHASTHMGVMAGTCVSQKEIGVRR